MRRAGFTLMEVMVAILILAVSVVSIFGAQYAAVATAEYARYSTQAIQLARCRMSEIELEFQVEGGFETADVMSSGDCCEFLEGESSVSPFTCSWEIVAIEMPDISALGVGGGAADGGMPGDMGLGMDDAMSGFGMGDMIGAFAPMITDMLREAMRRVTVTVEWKQGSRQREFTLSQYVVHPTQGPLQLMHGALAADEALEQMTGEGDPETGAPSVTPDGQKRER